MNEFHRKLMDIVGANSYVATFGEPNRPILSIEPYTYAINTTKIGVGILQNQIGLTPLVMDNDSDFVMCSITGATLCPAAHGFSEDTIPNQSSSCLINIKNLSTGMTFLNHPVPLGMIAGCAGYPFFLPRPYIVQARSTLQIQAASDPFTSEDTFSRLWMTFNGAKIYYA